MATVAGERLFGKAIKRREDPRFITGRGQYVDDVKLPGMTYAAFVRSQHAHAKIRRIDASAALKHPGVVAVFTGKDMTGVNSLPCGWDLRKEKNIPGVVQDLAMVPHMPLMSDAARHVGDPVAVVIADSQAAAVDAADKVKVDWEPLPPVTATDKAARAGAPQIHTSAPGNVAFKWEIGDRSATDAAFKGAAVTVKKRILNQRLVANAMEPRACIARFDTATGELTLWVTSQNPHVHRLLMCAFVLGIPEHKVRVIAPDVGGGFGSKIFLYNEEVVCSWASRQLKRPARGLLRPGAYRRGRSPCPRDGRGRAPEEELHPEVLGRLPDPRGGVVRQRGLRGCFRQAPPDARLQEVPRRTGCVAEAGAAPRHWLLNLHRGVFDRALEARGRARRRRRPLRIGQGPRAPDRRGHGLHRFTLTRPGARDDVRPARRRRAPDSHRAGRHRPRRHRRDPLRHGDVREPLRFGRWHRHSP